MTLASRRERQGDPKLIIGLWSAFALPPAGGRAKPPALAAGTNPFYLARN